MAYQRNGEGTIYPFLPKIPSEGWWANYSFHGWSTASSYMTNPSSTHTIMMDGVKEATVDRFSPRDQDFGLTAICHVHKYIRSICRQVVCMWPSVIIMIS
jgi:hypothetical protein